MAKRRVNLFTAFYALDEVALALHNLILRQFAVSLALVRPDVAKGVASSGVCGRQGMLRLPKKRRIAEAGATWQADNAATCCAGGFSWRAQFGPPNRFQRSGRRRRWQPQACWQQSLGVSICALVYHMCASVLALHACSRLPRKQRRRSRRWRSQVTVLQDCWLAELISTC